jgi:O-antigen/teichoic acid export membrane protein
MLAAATAAALLSGSLVGICAGIAAAWAVALVTIDVRALRVLGARDPAPAVAPPAGLVALARSARVTARTWRMLRESAPLGIVALALSLTVSVPRFAIERHLGVRALGYFAALAYLVVAGRMVALAFGGAAVPRLGQQHAAGDRAAFRRTLGRLVTFGAALGAGGVVGAWWLGAPALRLLYGPDYAAHAPLLVWLMLAAGFGYVATYLQDALTTVRILVPKALLLLAVLATVSVLSAVLVPRHGLLGAALAVVGASALELAGSALLVLRVLRAPSARGATGADASGASAASALPLARGQN